MLVPISMPELSAQKVHFNLHLKKIKTPDDCHMYYVANLHHFHAFFI
jgi:hypothetical protein